MGGKRSYSAAFCLYLALLLLILPMRWVLAMVAAACFHELCHMGAIRLCKKFTPAPGIYATGARLSLPEMSRKAELICSLAGPAGSLLLLLFAKWCPRLALCAAMQSAYNLLPIYPLDGGRAVQCFLSMVLPPPKAKVIMFTIEEAIILLVLLLGAYGSFALQLGLLPILMSVTLYFRSKSGKILAKRRGSEYNSVITNR